MICSECQTENPAGARFCIQCGAALARRCTSCQSELPAAARFCPNCGQPVQTTTSADQARLSRLAAATPASLAAKMRAAASLAGERRLVTVLFADVVGSTALAEELGTETWIGVMNGAFERITPAVHRYEGTVARLVGDGLWAFFGAPVAHEDDPLRAVQAALDLLDSARGYASEVRSSHGIDFAMRACLNTGPVVIGDVGPDLRYEYTAMSGTVNLAARLKFAAEPMTALVTESTQRHVAPLFDWIDRGPIEVRGQPEPVRVYELLGPRDRPGRTRGLEVTGLESPMVGREGELNALLQLCEAVQAGLGRAVLVAGEPGLGKTRLIAEWRLAVGARHSPGPRWAEGRCLSYGQSLAYHLLVHLLRSLLGVSERADETETHAALLDLTRELFGDGRWEVYPYLGHLLKLRLEDRALEQLRVLDPQAVQTQYVEALRRLLSALAAQGPLVLVLEDIHWADPSSVDLLVKLLPLATTLPVLFCLVTRPERDVPGWRLVAAAREVLGSSLTEITLSALSEAESRRLVANLLHIEALPASVRALILKKTEGNPFFVEEVLRMLIDQGAIVRRDGDWRADAEIHRVEIPDNLHSLLLARIDRLPADVRHTLRVASVIGRQFPVRVLTDILEGQGS